MLELVVARGTGGTGAASEPNHAAADVGSHSKKATAAMRPAVDGIRHARSVGASGVMRWMAPL